MPWKPLNDKQWEFIEPLIPKQRMGRPRSRNREILDAILFVLSTNIRWEEMPPGFPAKMTVYDRFRVWVQDGFFELLFERVKAIKPPTDKRLYYLDATIKSAKKGQENFTSRENKRQQNKSRGRRERTA
jgi:transposase